MAKIGIGDDLDDYGGGLRGAVWVHVQVLIAELADGQVARLRNRTWSKDDNGNNVCNQWMDIYIKNPWICIFVRNGAASKKFHHEAFDVGVLFFGSRPWTPFCRV